MATLVKNAPFHEGGRLVSQSTLTAVDHKLKTQLGLSARSNFQLCFNLMFRRLSSNSCLHFKRGAKKLATIEQQRGIFRAGPAAYRPLKIVWFQH